MVHSNIVFVLILCMYLYLCTLIPLHPIDVENYAEAMTHPKPALHPIDVENYDASHWDDEDEAEKDFAASYRIE
ncbi:hypothetical protein Tco_1028931 [Tanacetum coccineum]|uniref:Uncharacterized protein n=1 Tax=Tanacetum coccineum TaxID=301880 RepID=A0ABQ5G3E8_9ASTR